MFIFQLLAQTEPLFGSVTNPIASGYGDIGSEGAGLVGFLSNIIKLITVAGGIFAFFNLVLAGISYIGSQGDPQAIEKAQKKIYMSIVGMVIIASSYVLAALIGRILFGSYTAILQPVIYGPGS